MRKAQVMRGRRIPTPLEAVKANALSPSSQSMPPVNRDGFRLRFTSMFPFWEGGGSQVHYWSDFP